MIEYLIVAGAVGTALVVADQQNVFGINPEKKWFWERPPFAQPPAARATFPRPMPMNTEGVYRAQLLQQQRIEEAEAKRQSKYVITDATSPPTAWKPYQK